MSKNGTIAIQQNGKKEVETSNVKELKPAVEVQPKPEVTIAQGLEIAEKLSGLYAKRENVARELQSYINSSLFYAAGQLYDQNNPPPIPQIVQLNVVRDGGPVPLPPGHAGAPTILPHHLNIRSGGQTSTVTIPYCAPLFGGLFGPY